MKYISFDDICNLEITPADSLKWAETVIKNKKKCVLPPKISIHIQNDGFFNTMPSLIPDINRFGVKEVSRIHNRLPALQADILLYDSLSGELLSFMDGTWITTMRTGAVAALTVEKLKKSGTRNYSFIGLGNTARSTLLCLLELNKNKLLEINLLKYKNQHEDFINRFKEYSNVHFNIYSDVKAMIRSSDVIISCVTVANDLFAEVEDYKDGVLVVPVHTRGFQNCDLAFDKIFCDDIAHISGFKYFSQYKSVTEMTEVLNSEKSGRDNDKQRLLAYNIGIALHDIYFASMIYDKLSMKNENTKSKFWV